MRVLLIRPNVLRPQDRDAHLPSVVYPLVDLASYADAPDSVRIALFPDDREYILDSLDWCDMVGFGASTYEYEAVRRIARELRTVAPDKPFFLGGHHVTLLRRFDAGLFRFGVAGEAERLIRDLARDWIDIPGGPGEPVIVAGEDLPAGEIPAPRYRLYRGSRRFRDGNSGNLGLLASRGCPYRNCRFCASVGIAGRFRRLPADELAGQIGGIARDGFRTRINFWDDALAGDHRYLLRLHAGLERRGISIAGSSCFIRCTDRPIPDDHWRLLERLGFHVLLPGIESGSDRLLKYLKGPAASQAVLRRNLEAASRHGFSLMGSVMVGNPTESEAEMEETVRFIEWFGRSVRGRLWVYLATPWPGTGYWDIALARGTVDPEMDFDLLGYDRAGEPRLLDPGFDRERFRRLWAEAGALAGRTGGEGVGA